MPIAYAIKTVKTKFPSGFVCDRCRSSYENLDCAHVLHHNFGFGSACDGDSVEIVLCEECLLKLAEEWSVPVVRSEHKQTKHIDETIGGSVKNMHSDSVLMQHDPVHPGPFLMAVYLRPKRTSIATAAKMLGVDPGWMRKFVSAKSDVTQRIANKLAKHFGGTPESWLAMQAQFKGSIKRLKGLIPPPAQPVSIKNMNAAIRKSATKSAKR